MQPQRFLFIDPTLRDKRGHNLDYARLVIADASAVGFECRIFAHASSTIEPRDVRCSVERYFAYAHTEAPVTHGAAKSFQRTFGDRAYRAARSVRRLVTPTPVLADRNSRIELSRARTFAAEASELLARLAPTACDRIFLPNLLWSEAVALTELLANEGIAGGADIQILMRFDPPTGAVSARALARAGETAAITWLADTDELVEAYADLLHTKVVRAPVPIDGPALRQAALTRSSPNPVVVSALGESRREKGFLLLPDMIAHVLKEDTGVRFEIQASLNMPGGEPGVSAAIAALQDLQGPNLNLLPPQLSSTEFAEVLGSSHVLLMPYHASSYSRRSSGLLLHGLAAGLWIVAPQTARAMAACVERNNRQDQVVFCDPSIKNYADGLREAIKYARDTPLDTPSQLPEEHIPTPWTRPTFSDARS